MRGNISNPHHLEGKAALAAVLLSIDDNEGEHLKSTSS